MGVLNDKLAAHQPKIDVLCQTDKTFREIIGDYEELTLLMDQGPSMDQIDHIQSSLAGLEEEIMAYLATLPERTSDLPNE